MGEPDALYLNDGKGNFAPVSWTDGRFLDEAGRPLKGEPYDMGLSVLFHDINGDGTPDIYVCNDFQTPDRIWINDGTGKFRALPDLALRSTSHFSIHDLADLRRRWIASANLCHPQPMLATVHVADEEVIEPVAVDVGEVHTH